MVERVRRLLEGPVRGVLASIVAHAVLLALVILVAVPGPRPLVKRGEPLFIELPELPEPPPAGNPAARSAGPPARDERPAARQPARSAEASRPAPQARRGDVVASRPAPEPPRLSPAPPAPRPPVPAAESRTPAPEPPVAPETPKPPAAEPATPDPAPPAVAATPPPPATPPTPPAAAPPPPVAAAPQPRPEAPQPAEPASPPATAGRPVQPDAGGGQHIASVPPARDPAPPVDIRSLGRGGGAGSARGGGRGGIEGEPIPLDSKDPRYSDYLDHVRRKIKANWGYPCVKNASTRECEYKTATLVVEFGIAKDGRVPFVNVVRSSGWPIYDDYAVNAIKFASPFLPVPDALGKKGIPVLATFNYVVDASLTNLLR